jgi:anti-repressor protein
MATEIKRFEFEEMPIRVIMKGDQPWWVAKDVCHVLGLTNPSKVLESLERSEVGINTIYTNAGLRSVGMVNESGLWAIVLRSRKPEAKAFRLWITSEVIPSVMRTGKYSTQERPLVEVLEAITKEMRAQEAQLALKDSQLANKDTEILQRNHQLALNAPKVESFDNLISGNGLHSFNAAAKVLNRATPGIGPLKLIQLLLSEGIIYKANGGPRDEYFPAQSHANAGRFAVTTDTYRHPHKPGVKVTYHVTRVTSKGLDWLRRRVCVDKEKKLYWNHDPRLADSSTTLQLN